MLAIRRIIYYLIRKFEGKSDGVKRLTTHFGSIDGFNNSGLRDSDSCAWLAGVPDFVSEVVQFLAKLLRASKAYMEILETVLKQDPVASAEASAFELIRSIALLTADRA